MSLDAAIATPLAEAVLEIVVWLVHRGERHDDATDDRLKRIARDVADEAIEAARAKLAEQNLVAAFETLGEAAERLRVELRRLDALMPAAPAATDGDLT